MFYGPPPNEALRISKRNDYDSFLFRTSHLLAILSATQVDFYELCIRSFMIVFDTEKYDRNTVPGIT